MIDFTTTFGSYFKVTMREDDDLYFFSTKALSKYISNHYIGWDIIEFIQDKHLIIMNYGGDNYYYNDVRIFDTKDELAQAVLELVTAK